MDFVVPQPEPADKKSMSIGKSRLAIRRMRMAVLPEYELNKKLKFRTHYVLQKP